MDKTEFTPGPYNVVIEDHSIEIEGKKRIFDQLFTFHGNDNETEATTHLLAAAPEMYALLDMMQTFLEVSGDENTRIAFLTQIKKVLAKARGEE